MTKKPAPTLRGGTWYLIRRVPRRYAGIEPRDKVRVSLGTDSRETASRKAPAIWDQMIEAWEARLAGGTTDAQGRFEAARKLAAAKGYRYMDAIKVARLPLGELLDRIEAVADSRGRPDPVAAEALLGGAQRPEVTVSKALDMFYRVEAVRILGKSPDQLRRHKAPRLKATRNFIAAVGDLAIDAITTRDLFTFRAWWQTRISAGDVKPGSANKDFAYLTAIWRAVARAEDMDLQFKTDGLAFDEGKDRTRPPFSPEWISTRLLPGLARMNDEAGGIAEIMVNTGARPSEIAALTPARIVLGAAVPHIRIEAEGRTLKSQYAERTIPLVGVSLEAARRHAATGFPTYADNPALSDTINKFLTENGLRETPKHSLYSLRHSFESRMMKADFPERLRADLMGHRLERERYGEADIAHVRDWLLKIAL